MPWAEAAELRYLFLTRIHRGDAHWILPEKNDSVWIYGTELEIGPWVRITANQRHEFIPGNDPSLIQPALEAWISSFPQNEERLFWTRWRLGEIPPDFRYVGESLWGFFDVPPRLRLESRRRNALAVALEMQIPVVSGSRENHLGEKAGYRPHPGFPPPLTGHAYRWPAPESVRS